MTVQTKFELGQIIWITDLEVRGRIMAIYITMVGGIQYQVRFFDCKDVNTVYFLEDELSDQVPQKGNIGLDKKS